jgi:hypothetical protein
MERKTYPTIFRNFSIALLLLFSSNIFSCGWGESYETSRLALFRASRPNFIKLGDYGYSLDLYSESTKVSDRDQKQNCREWIAKLGGTIKVDDVYAILYQTNAEEFENAMQSNALATVFKDNSFVKSLSLPKNKPFLDYISVAKQMEYSHQNDGKWESWEVSENQSEGVNDYAKRYIEFDKIIKKTKDLFLKQRYAFLQLRSIFYEGMTAYELDKNETPNTIQSLYDTYFKDNTKTILAPWAMYYMALKLENKALANYYLSKVLVNCDDKGNAVIRHFDEKLTNETLAFAQNDFERGIIKSIKLLYNPAPALEDLKEIAVLMPESEYFSFLVQREVNKIEDWIFTPKYSNSTRSDYINYDESKTEEDYAKARLENEQKDLKYLQDLKVLLIEIQEKSSGEQKDFLSSAVAQLCFINDEIDAGNAYTQQISEKANPSIQLQKNVQLALVALKQNDIKTPETQEKLYNCFNDIENAVEKDNTLFKSMYSLYRIASADFYDKKEIATAGLLYMKSGTKQGNITDYSYYDFYGMMRFYDYIGYFDRMATPKDMDVLIALTEKSDKSNFEKYICSGNIAQDVNVYRDLKGTLAFRNNDLELASKTFSEMPKDFWEKTYEFKNYLNENPFFPKALQTDPKSRNFKYKFNKLDFVNEMIKLQKSKLASDYLKLANAYFNVSAYGNAWMMTSYEQSGGSYNDYIYGDSTENEKKYGLGNYLNLDLAKEFYQKALLSSTNKEQKAVCSLMLFECDYYNNSAFTYDKEGKFTVLYKGNAVKDFYSIYEDTKVFKKYNCPLLENFIN